MTTAITDNDSLRRTLAKRFSIPENEARKIRLIYTPAKTEVGREPLTRTGSEASLAGRRPRILWAGRLDRQKRFDLLIDIAAAMPDVDFLCWGKAVLDAPPNLSALPANVRMQGAFASFDDLPLGEAEGFLYTSAWDGLPTILIELGARGVPIVASAVGGVPELIDEACGWPVPGDAGREAYVAALRDLLAHPQTRHARAAQLQRKIAAQHGWAGYAEAFARIVRDHQMA
jgi:glycosyltransferase involved in cell wall biosynthesis